MPPKSRKKAKGSFHLLKLVLIGGGLCLVLLLVVLLVAKSMVNDWLRGEGFREWIAQRAGAALRSEVVLGPLEWRGGEVHAKRFEARGRPEANFSELILDGMRARGGGLEDRAFQVPEVSVQRLDLRFSPERKAESIAGAATDPVAGAAGNPVAGAATDPVATASEFSPPAAGAASLPSWLARRLPNRVEVGRIAIGSARVSVEREGGPVFLLNGTRAELIPDFRSGSSEISARGGSLTLPNQPEIALKDLALRWKGSEIFIDRCALGIYEKGHIEGRGEIGFADAGRFDVELAISDIAIDELIEGEWRDRLDGTLHGPVRITGAPGSLVYEGTLHVSEGVVEAIPILKLIARYTRSDRFERIVLNRAEVDFKREGERLELRRLVLQSDGLVRVEGEIDLVGDQLAGRLQVGVVPGTMRWIPGAERLVFTEARDGFHWAPLALSGTTAQPKEDLSARLVAAAGEEVMGALPETLLDGAKGLLTPSTGAPSTTEDLLRQGQKMLDLLTPLLKAP